MEEAVLDYGAVERLARARRRDAERLSLLLRMKPEAQPRGGRRSLRDSLRLAELAVEASRSMLEVVTWGKAWRERALRLKLKQ